ncbi:MAG: HigA family addiction module antidote protein [Deltaproteobacteria bacterium]|nr:HigA family addiction module antidote protein [Deltaproteobacteria bacterium]
MAPERLPPVHPGHYLRELLDELEISQYRLAKAIDVPAMRISHIVHGRRPVTAEMALRLGLYFSQSPQYWMNLQARYDLDTAADALAEKLSRDITPLRAA